MERNYKKEITKYSYYAIGNDINIFKHLLTAEVIVISRAHSPQNKIKNRTVMY